MRLGITPPLLSKAWASNARVSCAVLGRMGPYRAHSRRHPRPPCAVLGRMGPYRAHLSAGTVHGRDAYVPESYTVPGSCPRLNWTAFEQPLRAKPMRTPAYRSPVVSSRPRAMFMFWTAAPEAPFPRLSNSAVTVVWSSLPQTTMCSSLVPASSFA